MAMAISLVPVLIESNENVDGLISAVADYEIPPLLTNTMEPNEVLDDFI